MDFFFIEYRDPIFGLIVLFAAALLVAISSYALGIWGVKDENRSIEKFVKNLKTLAVLAKTITKNAKVKTYETYFINPQFYFIVKNNI
ncbi:hypothetical protein [Campylobacter devanensis]|uniref:hypothetical protein n=1 Tax=Campylobacter devanensis TaxID=3161138 RepID=UPI0015D8B2D0|nr:hypothetical protein [Campylobacter sp. P160]